MKNNSYFIRRGGSWFVNTYFNGVYRREIASFNYYYLGFRVVLNIEIKESVENEI